jgi:hypothetical protein
MDPPHTGITNEDSARADVLDVLIAHQRWELEATVGRLERAKAASAALLALIVTLAGLNATVANTAPDAPSWLTGLVFATLAGGALAILVTAISNPESSTAQQEQATRKAKSSQAREALSDVRESSSPVAVRSLVLVALEARESELAEPARYKEQAAGIALILVVIAGFLLALSFASSDRSAPTSRQERRSVGAVWPQLLAGGSSSASPPAQYNALLAGR